MAYAALVSLAQTIDLILNYHQDSISPEVEDGVLSIRKWVDVTLKAFAEDFPDKSNSLEGRIREVTHAAEEVIELLLSKQIHESFLGPSKSKFQDMERGCWELSLEDRRCRRRLCCSGNHQTWRKYSQFQYDLYHLNKVTKQIESIAEKVMEIKNSIRVTDVRLDDSIAASLSSTVAPVHKDAMVGCDDDMMEIKSRVCGGPSKLEFVPIVGMGGIGKTTLARNVYDNPYIVEYFDICVWVTVTQYYSVQEIVSSLLVSMKVFNAKKEPMKTHHVYQNLKGRRYLLVLDDVWSGKAWDDLKVMFPDDGNGSRIMLTTRLSDVASYIDSCSPIHEMNLMDAYQSWNLLRQKVFRRDPCPIELEGVGKMIARSCRGLPLAIVVISGLLTVDQTKAAWGNIAKDVKSAISANDEQLDKILSLSYTHLPHHLRPCFLYMGGFPENYKMRVSELIRLWVAEGFLKPNGRKSFEETADEYLEDLVKRSLVLVTERKSNGRIKNLSIHDLMREMCLRKAQEENFILYVRGFLQEGIKIPRCQSIFHNDLDFQENFVGSTTRTIICVNSTGSEGRPCCLGHFRLLRILNMSGAHGFFHPHLSNGSLPDEVFELFHLRYLSLDHSFKIPAAISNLQNLQTLIINHQSPFHRESVKLPVEIWRMPQLRHLIVCDCDLPVCSEKEDAFGLANLQTLSTARNFICTPKVLKIIPNLKKIVVRFQRSEDMCEEDYQLHNLIYLQQLEKLKLQIEYDFPYGKRVHPAFPRTLKRLTLSGIGLVRWEDMTIVGSLPNLEVLKLINHACLGDTWDTTEGEFSQLMCLLIDRSDLKHWITESSHFPKLKCLMLRFCSYLREIPDGIGEIPTLELIEVTNRDLEKSAKQIQEEQLSYGNDALQVRVHR